MCYIYNSTVANKVFSILGKENLDNIINKYQGNYKVRYFDVESQIKLLIAINILSLNSLRDAVTQLGSCLPLSREINIPSVSQISRANAQRDINMYREIFEKLVAKSLSYCKNTKLTKNIKDISIIDATVVTLGIKLSPNLAYKGSRAGIKANVSINAEGIPTGVEVVAASIADVKCLGNLINDPNKTYIFDRGYLKYSLLDELTTKGIRFITRLKKNSKVQEVNLLSCDLDSNIYDTEIILGGKPLEHRYRKIEVYDEVNEEWLTYVTNIFDINASEIAEAYRRRWDIECFFKFMKSNLRMKKCLGYNKNALTIQIYASLITYLLLYILQKETNSSKGLLDIKRILASNFREIYSSSIHNLLTRRSYNNFIV